MPVDTQHPELRLAKPRYKLIRAIINNTAMSYIRKPEPEGMCDSYETDRNLQYREDAILTNFTNFTREGLTGLIFRKPLKLKLPKGMEYLEDNFTGAGINIYQASQHMASETLQLGRYGLLVDFYEDGGKAYIKPYIAESIINWKTKQVDGVMKLSLIVLQEKVIKDDKDEFAQDEVTQYRVLRLNNDNVYTYQMYNQAAQAIGQEQQVTDYNGNPFDMIPFYFVGSENNDTSVDKQPLYDLALINLGHYRNSADYEESIFINGQPYLVVDVGEASQEEFLAANPSGIAFGSRKVLVLASGGTAQLLQANPNQLVAQAMKEKLEQAAKVGARLIESAGGRETAEAAKIRYGSQHASLYTLTSNMSWGGADAIRAACVFMGTDPTQVEYELNSDFYEQTADANLLAQQIMLLDRGIIAKDDIREYGRKTGFIEDNRTNEVLEAESEAELDPLEVDDDITRRANQTSNTTTASGENSGQED
mgnify:FL=1